MFQHVSAGFTAMAGGNRHLRRLRDCRNCRSCRESCRATAATAALLEDLGLPSVESYGAAEGPGHHTMKLCQGTK